MRYYEDCLRVSKTVLGENHSDTLRCVIALANLYQGQGEYGKAFPLFEECLKNKQVVSREEHPDTLTFMNTLALLLYIEIKESMIRLCRYLKSVCRKGKLYSERIVLTH